MTRESQTLLNLLNLVEDKLPADQLRLIKDYIDANEYGLGFELLLELISNHKVHVTEEFKQKAIWCGDQMRIDVAPYFQI